MPFFRKISVLIIFSCFFCLINSYGQEFSSAELKLMTVLNVNPAFAPKDLLTTKTVVIISMDDRSGNRIRGDWKELAREAHFYISRLGIDPVVYYYIDDLISGYDVKRAVTGQMLSRDIKNVLLLSKDKIEGRDQYIGVITAFNQKPTFVSHSQVAWKSQTSDLEILFRNLARTIDNADLTLENLMILDQPEFFRGVDILKGRRYESFNTDLRIDRIAIPSFEELPSVDGAEAGSSELAKTINRENELNLERNAQLEQIMAKYPYEFRIVPYEYDEQKLLTKGFQFVLLQLTSSGRNVRELLGYKVDDQVNELITMKKDENDDIVVKAIPIDGMVTKYYIKHISSGEVYLGEQWDGDDNWRDALKNHLNLLIEKLAENR
jgi:hypothetical protein